MKFIESFSSVMAPIMTGKQAPLAVDGLVQQAQRLLGVPSDLVYYDADVQTELTLLAAEYYGVLPLFSWDKYNWEAEALGQTLLVRELGLPDIDSRNPLIRSEADFDKIKWPTQNPLDAGRYPLEIQQAQVAAKYYPYQLKSIMMASSFSVACNICGGPEFIPLTIEEPEFCHAVIQKITDDIHTPLIFALGERFPNISITFVDAWEVPPNLSISAMKEFAWAYYDRLLENTEGANVNLNWYVAYGEQYMKDPYAFIVEKATKYSHRVLNTNLEKCALENYRRAAIDTGLPLASVIPSTVIQERNKQKIIDFVREQAKGLRPGVKNFAWSLACPATVSEYDIKAAIAIVNAFGTLPAPSTEELDQIEVVLPEVEETFCEFVRRKAKDNPDGFTFKWMDEGRFAE